MRLPKQFQNTLLTFSLFLCNSVDYGLPSEKREDYWNYGVLNFLDFLNETEKICFVIFQTVFILRTVLKLYKMDLNFRSEVIEMFVFPVQSYLCWKEIMFGENKDNYYLFGINLGILYGFYLFKIFYLNNYFEDYSSVGLKKRNKNASIIQMFRIIILAVAYPYIGQIIMIPLIGLQLLNIGLRVHYIVYEDPQYDYIGCVSEVNATFALIKYYMILNNINTVAFNIIFLCFLYISMNPNQQIALLWWSKINSVLKENKKKQITLVYLFYSLNVYVQEGKLLHFISPYKLYKKIQKGIQIQVTATELFNCSKKGYRERLQELWRIALMMKMHNSSRVKDYIFLTYRFRELMYHQLPPLLMFYKAKIRQHSEKMGFIENVQLHNFYNVIKEYSLNHSLNYNILEYERVKERIQVRMREFAEEEGKYYHFHKINEYSIDFIKQYLNNKHQMKKEVRVCINELKILNENSLEIQFYEYYLQKYIQNKDTNILDRIRQIYKINHNDVSLIKKNQGQVPICLCKALQVPGRIKFMNNHFINMINFKVLPINIDELFPQSWKEKHHNLLLQSRINGLQNNHSSNYCYIQTGDCLKEVRIEIQYYIQSQQQLLYLIHFYPTPHKSITFIKINEQNNHLNPKTNKELTLTPSEKELMEIERQERTIFNENYLIIKRQNYNFKEKLFEKEEVKQQTQQKSHFPKTKFQNFHKHKNEVNLFGKTRCFFIIMAIIINVSLISFVYFATSNLSTLIERSNNIENFFVSYYKNIAIHEVLTPINQYMVSFGKDSHPFLYNQSLQFLREDWMKKQVFALDTNNIIFEDGVKQLIYLPAENNYTRYDQAHIDIIPIKYITKQSQKSHQKTLSEIETFEVDYRMENEKINMFQEGIKEDVLNIGTTFMKTQDRTLLWLLLSLLIMLLLGLGLYTYGFVQYELRVMNLLKIIKYITHKTFNSIKRNNHKLCQVLKLDKKVQNYNEQDIELEDEYFVVEDYELKPEDRRIQQQSILTNNLKLFLVMVIIILSIFVLVLVNTSYLIDQHNQKYTQFVQGLDEFSELVMILSNSIIYLDLPYSNITQEQWMHNYYMKILEADIDDIIHKLIVNDISHNVIYDDICKELIQCNNIQNFDSLTNLLSLTKNKLIQSYRELSGDTFRNNKEQFYILSHKMLIIHKIYSEIVSFSLHILSDHEKENILSSVQWIIVPLALLIIHSAVFITTIVRKSKLYQEEIFSVSTPENLYHSEPYQFYINSIHHKINLGQQV